MKNRPAHRDAENIRIDVALGKLYAKRDARAAELQRIQNEIGLLEYRKARNIKNE